jgi:hypothetical protein
VTGLAESSIRATACNHNHIAPHTLALLAGLQAMERMHAAVRKLLDPSGWHGQLPMLQPGPCGSARGRQHTQTHSQVKPLSATTSTFIRAAVGMPASARARQLMRTHGY